MLAVRLTPKARAAGIGPVVLGADGRGVLKVAVTEAPEKGKANEALVSLLAKTWRLPKGAIEVVKGATERNKMLLIRADEAEIAKRFAAGKL
jgi:uncharacterized protein (TIGR00251 family)